MQKHQLLSHICSACKAIRLNKEDNRPSVIGSIACGSEGVPAVLPYPEVSERHASIVHKDNAFFLTDMGSQHGTWIIE